MPLSDELLLTLKEIGASDIADSLGSVATELSKLSDAEKGLADQQAALAENSDAATGSFSKMQAGLVSLSAGINVAEQVLGTFKQAWNFAKEGAEIQRVNEQFANMAESVNVNADHLLSGLNRAAHGTVDGTALMQTATRAMALGIANNADDLIKLMEIARASSVAFGGDTASAFERISNAVENLAPRSLKQSGIVIDLTQAFNDYAAQLGKTSDQLTDGEKRQALLNQTLEKGADLVKKIGDAGEDAATRMDRFETKVGDIFDQLKSGAVGAVLPYLDALDVLEKGTDQNATTLEQYNSILALAIDLYGENSAQVKLLREEIDKLNTLMKEVGLTSQEAALRANMAKVRTMEAINPNAATNISAFTPEKQQEAAKAYQDYQSKLTGIEDKYDTARAKAVEDMTSAINKLEADAGRKRVEIVANFAADEAERLSDMQDKRVSILMDYADNEQKITTQQNADRLKLAQQYGLETERMEQAHQLGMARMQEDHTRNLRKLADSRDALGIEDEQENYQVTRRRAEEDYQIQAGQRSADYARQLADQNASFEEQRNARAEERDKQLVELSAQFAKQDDKYKAAYNKQLADLDQHTRDQRQQLWQAEDQKLRDLRIQQDAERAQAITQWTLWRNEHGIFLTGEKALWDDYLKYTADQLKAYITGGGVTPTMQPIGHPNAPGRAAGGMVSPFGAYTVGEHGPELLYMGNQGGYVSPMGLSIGKIDINVAGTNATPQDIMTAVYTGITQVIEKAMRQ